MTKSPPTKKVKGHHDIDMDTEPLDIVKQKDDEIIALKSTINLLKQKLQDAEDTAVNRVKPNEILESTNKKYTYKCEMCDEEFTSKSIMLKHINEHKGHLEENKIPDINISNVPVVTNKEVPIPEYP